MREKEVPNYLSVDMFVSESWLHKAECSYFLSHLFLPYFILFYFCTLLIYSRKYFCFGGYLYSH